MLSRFIQRQILSYDWIETTPLDTHVTNPSFDQPCEPGCQSIELMSVSRTGHQSIRLAVSPKSGPAAELVLARGAEDACYRVGARRRSGRNIDGARDTCQ